MTSVLVGAPRVREVSTAWVSPTSDPQSQQRGRMFRNKGHFLRERLGKSRTERVTPPPTPHGCFCLLQTKNLISSQWPDSQRYLVFWARSSCFFSACNLGYCSLQVAFLENNKIVEGQALPQKNTFMIGYQGYMVRLANRCPENKGNLREEQNYTFK